MLADTIGRSASRVSTRFLGDFQGNGRKGWKLLRITTRHKRPFVLLLAAAVSVITAARPTFAFEDFKPTDPINVVCTIDMLTDVVPNVSGEAMETHDA